MDEEQEWRVATAYRTNTHLPSAGSSERYVCAAGDEGGVCVCVRQHLHVQHEGLSVRVHLQDDGGM